MGTGRGSQVSPKPSPGWIPPALSACLQSGGSLTILFARDATKILFGSLDGGIFFLVAIKDLARSLPGLQEEQLT